MPTGLRPASPSRLAPAATYFHSLLRIIAGFLYWCHGAQKLFGVWGGHKAPMFSMPGAAGIIELIGGTLIIIGLFTRPTAFILSGEMAVAYFEVHARRAPLPIQNGGELAVLFAFLFLWLVFAGPGAVSIDALIRHRS